MQGKVTILIYLWMMSLNDCSQILATTYFDFSNSPSNGYYNFDALLAVKYDSNSTMSYFMCHQFGFHFGNNGYLGFQSNDNNKMVIFQIWSAINCSSSNKLNAKCIAGNSEGDFWSIQMPYNYNQSILYQFHLSLMDNNNWWGLSLINQNENDNQIFLGQIQVPLNWKNIGVTNAYLQKTNSGQNCDNLPQTGSFIFGQQFNNKTYKPSNITVIFGDPQYNVTCPSISDKTVNNTNVDIIIQKK